MKINVDEVSVLGDRFLREGSGRGDVCFPAHHPSVKDGKDHFPINNAAQARNALARANQYSSAPEWWGGSLKSLVLAVAKKVHARFPSIEVSEAAKRPGRG